LGRGRELVSLCPRSPCKGPSTRPNGLCPATRALATQTAKTTKPPEHQPAPQQRLCDEEEADPELARGCADAIQCLAGGDGGDAEAAGGAAEA
jgi:hypothetical protein